MQHHAKYVTMIFLGAIYNNISRLLNSHSLTMTFIYSYRQSIGLEITPEWICDFWINLLSLDSIVHAV